MLSVSIFLVSFDCKLLLVVILEWISVVVLCALLFRLLLPVLAFALECEAPCVLSNVSMTRGQRSLTYNGNYCAYNTLPLLHLILLPANSYNPMFKKLLQALKGSKIQVETSYCSQDPRDRFNSSHYHSYRTHHHYRVMMLSTISIFYVCFVCCLLLRMTPLTNCSSKIHLS